MAKEKFRELIQPGSTFEFMGRAKLWFTISILVSIACIAMLFINKSWRGDYMNWGTDFKGGTEIHLGFFEKDGQMPATVDSGAVRKALGDAGFEAFELSDYTWEADTPQGPKKATGMLVRTPHFGAVPAELREKVVDAFINKDFADKKPRKANWSGDTLHVRSLQPIPWQAAHDFLGKFGLTLKPWEKEDAERAVISEEGTGEYSCQLSVVGIDGQYRDAVQRGLGNDVQVKVINVYGVGAKAGTKLRDDGIASMFYAMLLIMLYLVVRFDIRYAPGAVVALLHDAIVVIGAFAVTWQEFSLTTVAAILTIIGYSVNDTVIIFDRIRENAGKLKDKKFMRIMNISINETLSRSLLTSLTVFVTTLMMNIFGTGLVRNFAFAMNVGVVTGTYSSIFIASPVALWLHNRFYARAEAAGPARPGRGQVKPDAEEADEGDDEESGADGRV
jgi:preprotein translocase subunit SecF